MPNETKTITTRQVLKFALLPGVIPMARDLVGSGFSHVSFFMAQVFRAARLLPPGHPYLSPQNIRKFGISNVLGEAYRNLQFNKSHADQIVIFSIVCLGFLLLLLQIGILLFSLMVQTAKAAMPAGYGDFFKIQNAQNDIAFILLDRVFGVPGMFTDANGGGTCVATNTPCLQSTVPDGPWPFAYHGALHDMLQFYSIGLMVIAVIIFLYFAVAIVVETAQSGTPFGRRFNHVWAPIRMVVALGLLVPLSYGLNGAQYVTLYAAKWGSNMASNGWSLFNQRLVGTTLLGNPNYLVASPQQPKPNDLLQFYTVLAACTKSYELLAEGKISINAYLVRSVTRAPEFMLLSDADWAQALEFYDNGDIIVVFGERDPLRHKNKPGYVMPYCGQLVMTTTDVQEPGSRFIQQSYYEGLIRAPWNQINTEDNGSYFINAGYAAVKEALPNSTAGSITNTMPTPQDRDDLVRSWSENIDMWVYYGTVEQIGGAEWLFTQQDLGWGGGGIWYNKIAQMNGAMIAAAYNIPFPTKYPAIMEYVLEEKRKKDNEIISQLRYQPTMADGVAVEFTEYGAALSSALNRAYDIWNVEAAGQPSGAENIPIPTSQNILIDVINAMFGTEGLFNMRNNANVHPLAQLVALGKSMVDSAITNLGIAAGSGAVATLSNLLNGLFGIGPLAGAFSSIASGVAFMTLSMGFVLYYVLPFLPFIYFFFAVGNWVKGVFEAMVGVPLWALAHIRIDGDGLMGDAAKDGYFLIFEIFMRPLFIVFGLIAAVSIFAAQVQVLNSIFDLVVSNLTGFNNEDAQNALDGQLGAWEFMRSTIDYFFHTVIYAIIVYMMGMASFKLITLIPNHVMYWLGTNVNGFGDFSGDPAEHLVRNVSMGANSVGGSLKGAAGSLQGMFAKQ